MGQDTKDNQANPLLADNLSPDMLAALPGPVKVRGIDKGSSGLGGGEVYIIPEPLLRATQVALMLGQPLFLTGDPGIGKSTYASAVAQRLKLGSPLRIIVKSSTAGRDLLYSFDDVGRFREATSGPNRTDPKDKTLSARPLPRFVRLNALGEAIVRSAGRKAKVKLSEAVAKELFGAAGSSRREVELQTLFPQAFEDVPPSVEGTRSVVLIDEIDKASREAPNDLLDEIEGMRFSIPEIEMMDGSPISAHPDRWPIVIITSNSERNLPDAFLRRCCFHHMELPGDSVLADIVVARVRSDRLSKDSVLMNGLLELFGELHKVPNIEKRPSLAEFISAAFLVHDLGFPGNLPPWESDRWEKSKSLLAAALVKKDNDQKTALLLFGKRKKSPAQESS